MGSVGPENLSVLTKIERLQVGDTFIIGDVTGGVLGRGASGKFGDITVLKQVVDQSNLDDEIQRVFKGAKDALNKLNLSEKDKGDAADDLVKLAAELKDPQRDLDRVQRLWSQIKALAPSVASILSSPASLARILNEQ
jgi:ABC-type transporter Mla subunit MlaD